MRDCKQGIQEVVSVSRASGFDVDSAVAFYVPEGAAVEVGHHSLQSGLVGDRCDPKLQCCVWLQLCNIADNTHTSGTQINDQILITARYINFSMFEFNINVF